MAVAPDLFGGVAPTVEEARAPRAAPRREPRYRILLRALGCSVGGHWALWLAARPALPIAATVTLYGASGAASRSVFQGHVAGHDPSVLAPSPRTFQRAVVKAGEPAEIHTDPGTGHWFFGADRAGAYDPAADLAWWRTLALLRAHLVAEAGESPSFIPAGSA